MTRYNNPELSLKTLKKKKKQIHVQEESVKSDPLGGIF